MAHALRELGDLQRALTDYQRALALCQDSGDQLMLSRVHHTLASLQWEMGMSDQALTHIQQALSISQEIGYGPGIAYGLIALGHFHAQQGEIHTARQLCWLLGTSVRKIDLFSTMEQAFLPKQMRREYNQRGPFCVYTLTTRLGS